jgi:hypothetical protein
MTDESKASPCFPYDKLDDMILFGIVALLILYAGFRDHWNLVESLSNNLIGAILMYIKGRGDKS